MEVLFNEQDIVDSICIYIALKERIEPQQVEVDLEFHPSLGFAASTLALGRTARLHEQDIIDAVAVYLQDYHQFVANHLQVNLSFSEKNGFTSSIQVLSN
ncbi:MULTISPECIES: DUF2653 family protein [Priestia]|jgi:hypothetical protein|uniref:DUF2653 family protein n=1 Tax=Priestia megaterium TaxID=1404 RepID=A0A6M6E360_PRIMG|nr:MULTISPECIES: DUF2653 family protein [Priestia]MCJ7988369.1 YxcD family protein [Priestia sp. OVS21]MBU8753933.1 YxcD family protein [Priestia megaterium]MBY0198708.1 DUF2653 family protein [Priestia megaterium]MCE4090828.1 YxcD family protein [Priestia megaterium]MCU7712825.1 YxcD family protein [Priestia megaterium]